MVMSVELELKQTFEEIRKSWEEFKAINERREEELKKYGQELGETKQALERIEKRLTDLEAAHQRKRIAGNVQTADAEFSFAKAIRGMVFGDWTDAELEKKALLESNNAAGGYLVPPEYASGVLDMIRSATVINRMGVTRLNPDGKPFFINKQTGGAQAYWVAENSDLQESGLTFDQVSMSPHKAGALVAMSNDLIRQANPAVEQIVRTDISRAMAGFLDRQMLDGDGTGQNLLGVLNTPSVNEVSLGADGGTPSIDTLYDALYEVEKNDGQVTAWVFHPRTKHTLRKIKDQNVQYILQPPVSASEAPSLLGLPYYETTAIPINLTVGTSTDCSYILAGDWREFVVAEWLGLEMEASREAAFVSGGQLVSAFSRDLTVVKAIQEVDCLVRRPQWFVKVTGVRP